jgi:predicted alpha/beta superfamily hydrolase
VISRTGSGREGSRRGPSPAFLVRGASGLIGRVARAAIAAWTIQSAIACAPASPTAPNPGLQGSVRPAAAQAGVTLRVTVPASTPAGDTVFVAGTFQQPTPWQPRDPAYALTRQPDGRWTITLDLPAGTHQFKFTRGGWGRVEKGPNGEEISNRSLTVSGPATHDFAVATWADLGTITGHVEYFEYAPFLGGRRCWVYLPPGYFESARSYPVLYMHDGQNLFDVRTSFAGEWHVDEACESLISTGQIEPIIVVGIQNSSSRIIEYTPWPDAGGLPGGGGDAYLVAIRDVLKPEVDRRYRTKPDALNTAMGGSSLGGLISAYAGFTYDATFGKILAMSSSYWWDDRHMLSYAQSQPKPDLARFYQDMGTIEEGAPSDDDGDGVDDYIEDVRAMHSICVGKGFVAGFDLLTIEGQNHTHSEVFWSQRLPNALEFLFGGPGIVGVP